MAEAVHRDAVGYVAAMGPAIMRVMNQRMLLHHLLTHGPATRPQMARATGLSQPTVVAALAGLEGAGLARQRGHPAQRKGRPALEFEADPTAAVVIGIDVGQKWIRSMSSDLSGRVTARYETPNESTRFSSLGEQLQEVVARLAEAANPAEAPRLTQVVIGCPGVVDPQTGAVSLAANLPEWQEPGVVTQLRQAFGAGTVIDNDANLAAVGEHVYGIATGRQHFAYLHLGTGIGLGMFLNGTLYRGSKGAAGEVGYLPIAATADELHPAYPPRGYLETAIAADALVGYARQDGSEERLTAEEVFYSALKGDVNAKGALVVEARYLAHLVASIGAFLDPELIVFGGGIGQNLELLEADLRRTLSSISPMQPELVVGELGSQAVVRGAIAMGVQIAQRELLDSASLSERGTPDPVDV